MRFLTGKKRLPVDPGNALLPVPNVVRVDPTKRGGVTRGRLLETARKRVSLSEAAAADRLRMSVSELLDYESGLRNPHPDVFDHMCETYGTTRDRMVSNAGIAIKETDQTMVLWIGWAPVELHGVSNRDRIFRIATTFRELRGLAEDAPVTIREDELPFICLAIDVNDEALLQDLADALLLTDRSTTELYARMRYRVTQVKQLERSSVELGPTQLDKQA